MALSDYVLCEDLLPGGKGDDLDPSQFDPDELAMGIEDEMEHTDDPDVAREVAIDHLSQNPTYYSDMKSAKHFFQED